MDIKTMVKLYKELIVEKIQKSEKKVFWQICDKFTEIAKKDSEAEKLFKRMYWCRNSSASFYKFF